MIERHKGRPRKIARANRPLPSIVLFDNDSSKSTTIIKVRTADRIGLLYLITGALLACRLDVQRAIIATEAYGVVDVFYVTDLEYNKIYNEKTSAGSKRRSWPRSSRRTSNNRAGPQRNENAIEYSCGREVDRRRNDKRPEADSGMAFFVVEMRRLAAALQGTCHRYEQANGQ